MPFIQEIIGQGSADSCGNVDITPNTAPETSDAETSLIPPEESSQEVTLTSGNEDSPPSSVDSDTIPSSSESVHSEYTYKDAVIPIQEINVDEAQCNLRRAASHFEDLKEDIREHGMLSSILVYEQEDERYRVLGGCTRLTAVKDIGWDEIHARIISGSLSPKKEAWLAYADNDRTSNFSVIRRAENFQELKNKFGWSNIQVAKYVKRAPSLVCMVLSCLKLPDSIKDQCRFEPEYSLTFLKNLVGEDADKQLKNFTRQQKKLTSYRVKSKKELEEAQESSKIMDTTGTAPPTKFSSSEEGSKPADVQELPSLQELPKSKKKRQKFNDKAVEIFKLYQTNEGKVFAKEDKEHLYALLREGLKAVGELEFAKMLWDKYGEFETV